MKRHPWKSPKYLRFEQAMRDKYGIDYLGVWLNNYRDDGHSWPWIARYLSEAVGDYISHESVRTWWHDWQEMHEQAPSWD